MARMNFPGTAQPSSIKQRPLPQLLLISPSSPPLRSLRHISWVPLSHTHHFSQLFSKAKFLSPGFREGGGRGKQIHEDPLMLQSRYLSPATGL